MTDENSEFIESDVAFPGPFSEHRVVVKGRRVPFLDASPQGEGGILLVLDDRFGLELSVADAERVVPFVANCIAVALGYTCHPTADEEPRESNPFARTMSILGFEGGEQS